MPRDASRAEMLEGLNALTTASIMQEAMATPIAQVYLLDIMAKTLLILTRAYVQTNIKPPPAEL